MSKYAVNFAPRREVLPGSVSGGERNRDDERISAAIGTAIFFLVVFAVMMLLKSCDVLPNTTPTTSSAATIHDGGPDGGFVR